ncbi:MAG: hypothetical protein ACI4K7_05605 [Oscillospiraceae bacterium]
MEEKIELPGLKKRSFSMFFGGGEIWFEHLDGIYTYTELAIEKLINDSKQFCRPSLPSLMAVNVDETVVTDQLIDAVSDRLLNTCKRFTRVAIVGADSYAVKRFKRAFREAGFALYFTNDFEKAKEWLVSEEHDI